MIPNESGQGGASIPGFGNQPESNSQRQRSRQERDEQRAAKGRPLTDLVGDDRSMFVFSRLLTTWSGGLKFISNDKIVPPYVILMQIVVYYTLPIIAVIGAVAVENRDEIAIPVTAGGFLIYATVILVANYVLCRVKFGKEKEVNMGIEDEYHFGICSLDNIKFFIKKPTNIFWLLFHIFHAGLVGAAIGYYFRKDRVMVFFDSDATYAVYLAISFLLMPTVTYSLVADNPHELDQLSTTRGGGYRFDPRANFILLFTFFELMFQEEAFKFDDATTTKNFLGTLRILYFFIPVPNVTGFTLWAVDLFNMHIGGASHHASMVRSMIVMVLRIGACLICTVLVVDQPKIAILLVAVFAFMFDLEPFLFRICGKNTPLIGRLFQKPLSHDIQTDLNYHFGSSEGNKQNDSFRNPAFVIITSIAYLSTGIGALAGGLYSGMEGDTLRLVALIMAGVAFIGSFLQYLISHTYKINIGRLIPCIMLNGLALKGYSAGITMVKVGQVALICFSLGLICQGDFIGFTSSVWWRFYAMVPLLRAFSSVLSYTQCTSFEVFILTLIYYLDSGASTWIIQEFNFSQGLLFISFIISRFPILKNKVVNMAGVIVASILNKKQWFTLQYGVFALMFTLWLPFTIGILFFTTLFNVPSIPILGFPCFIAGSLQPLRGWFKYRAIEPDLQDSRSDGLLYKSVKTKVLKEVSTLAAVDEFTFHEGQFFLIKNEKMIMLMQVLERGVNHLVVDIKASELQETTVCHAEENEAINELNKAVYGGEGKSRQIKPNPANAYTPLCNFNVNLYDDSKVKLTGIIDNRDFAKLLKANFMRTLGYYFDLESKQNLGLAYSKIIDGQIGHSDYEEMKQYYREPWLHHIRADLNRGIGTDYKPLQTQPEHNSQKGATRENFNNFLDQLENDHLGSGNQSVVPKSNVSYSEEEKPERQPDEYTHSNIPPENNYYLKGNKSLQKSEGQNWGGQQSPKGDMWNDLQEFDNGGEDKILQPKIAASAVTKPHKISAIHTSMHNQQVKSSVEIDDLDQILNQALPKVQVKGPQEQAAGNTLNDLDQILNDSSLLKVTNESNRNFLPPLSPNRASNLSNHEDSKKDQKSDDGWDLDFDGGQNESLIEDKDPLTRLIYEAFYLTFLKEYKFKFGGTPDTARQIFNMFNGHFDNDPSVNEFIRSTRPDIRLMRNIILKAFRVAFHISYEATIYGFTDEYTEEEFQTEIDGIKGKWFLGSEEHLWNTAIRKGVPNLERIIKDEEDGSYKGHRLTFGGGGDDTKKFYIYQIRQELVRGIWANMTTELTYFANNNDERFSIQADKNMLRNLLVQLCDMPFGYPVYASGPVYVPFNC